jgi:hypothetical protein
MNTLVATIAAETENMEGGELGKLNLVSQFEKRTWTNALNRTTKGVDNIVFIYSAVGPSAPARPLFLCRFKS